MQKKHTILMVVGLMILSTAVTPVRAWIPMVATLSLIVALTGIYGSPNYKRVVPRGLLTTGIVFIFCRAMQGSIKYPELTLYYIRLSLSEMLLIFAPLAITFALVAFADYRQFRKYVIAMLLITFPFFLVTIAADVGTSRTQMAVALRMNAEQAVQEAIEINRSGVMTYGPIHALMFVVVAAVMQIRHLTVMRDKVAAAIFAGVAMLTIIRSGFGYATYITLMLIALSCVGAKRKFVVIAGFAALSVVFIVLLKTGVLVSILEAVQQGFGYKNAIGSKAEEMAAILGGRMEDASDFSVRIDIYGRSWREFLANPIWGTNDQTRLGGHAYWIDVLGHWGIIGFLAEMAMMIAAFRYVMKTLPKSAVYYYVISIIAFIVICFFKAGAFHAQTPVLFGMAVPMLLFREDDFYAASNNIRRMFRLPPRMFGYG